MDTDRGVGMNRMRVRPEHDAAGIERGAPFEFTFDGRPILAYPGETVGAALTAAGVVALRTTRTLGRPRGLFCGIGICFDCLVVIDGRPNQRACLAPAQQGSAVHTQRGAAEDVYAALH